MIMSSAQTETELKQPQAESAVKLIPRSVLYGNPKRSRPDISPDGTRLAYLAPLDGVMNIWISEPGDATGQAVTRDTNRGIQRYFWANDSRHILYVQDRDGNENWRLFAVDMDTGDTKDYTPFENVQVRITAYDKRFPNELLIGLNKEDPQNHDVYHLDLTTGELTRVVKNPGGVLGWMADADFKVRCGIAVTAEGGFKLIHRETVEDDWRDLIVWEPGENMTNFPIGFTREGRHLYLMDSRGSNTTQLIKLECATGKVEVLLRDDTYDIGTGHVLIHPDTYDIQAVCIEKDRSHWVVIDPSIEEDFDVIRQLDHGDFSIISRDHADRTWIVNFSKDNGPTSYYLYDREKKKGALLFVNKPQLNEHRLAGTEPFTISSRDGLTLHGYITFPVDVERKNLPLVLLVHGGPNMRDHWGYSANAQWFSNRGYICLQVNYRGSIGFGKAFVNAANREWAGKMHDDLVDTVDWAVEQGYADPDRLAIYGASYGGYAALVGATFTPDLFCCAVDIVGPSNLVTLMNSYPPYWANLQEQSKRRIGDPDTEPEFLMSRSPLSRVDDIKIPILIGHGANDPRVPQAESEMIVEKMKEKGIDYEYLLFPDEGHGFVKPENKIKFQTVAEKFLAKHLGGRFEE